MIFIEGSQELKSYKLYNLMGQELVADKIKNVQYQLSLEDLAEGVYILVITVNNNQKQTFKVIKE